MGMWITNLFVLRCLRKRSGNKIPQHPGAAAENAALRQGYESFANHHRTKQHSLTAR